MPPSVRDLWLNETSVLGYLPIPPSSQGARLPHIPIATASPRLLGTRLLHSRRPARALIRRASHHACPGRASRSPAATPGPSPPVAPWPHACSARAPPPCHGAPPSGPSNSHTYASSTACANEFYVIILAVLAMVESFLALISTIHKSPHPIGRSIVVLTAACISKSASRSPKGLFSFCLLLSSIGGHLIASLP